MTIRALADSVPSTGIEGVGALHRGASEVLAYIPSPPQGVWEVGPFPIRAYALCIIAGIIVALWWGERRWQARGGQSGNVLDVAVFAVPFGIVGGRLYHIATDWHQYFGADRNPWDALKIYQGGLGIWGAVLFGALGAWIGCRVYRISLPAFGDALAPAILLAQAIGRLGNYFNQELYGRVTDVPWGLKIYQRFDADGVIDETSGVSSGVLDKIVHPTFLYEMLWNLAVVLLLVLIDRHWRIGHGRLFALYVAGYSFGRFFVELMRDDIATHIAGIRINSFTSALVFLAGLLYFLFATKGRETPAQLQPGAVNHPWPWQWGALRRLGTAPAEKTLIEQPADPREVDAAEDDGVDEKSDAAAPDLTKKAPEGESGSAAAETVDQDPDSAADSETRDDAAVSGAENQDDPDHAESRG